MRKTPIKQEAPGGRHRRAEACEGLLGEGMEGMSARTATSASPNLGPAVKKVNFLLFACTRQAVSWLVRRSKGFDWISC